MIKTVREMLSQVDEKVLRKMHYDSSAQGARYAYTCLLNELEWKVRESDMKIEDADELLAIMAENLDIKKPEKILPDYGDKSRAVFTPFEMTPYRRRIRAQRKAILRENAGAESKDGKK